MGRAAGRFVGRDGELSRLGDCVASARDGERTAVLVEGDAGIGKSRLISEALAAYREPKDVVAIGHGVELIGGELPYGSAADALRCLVRDHGPDAVRAAAGAAAPALAPLSAQLGTVDCCGADPLRLLPAYVSTLENLAHDRLVWLVIEDLHWVDAPSRDLLAYLLRVAGPCQLLTLITIRTHDPTVDPAAATLASNLTALAGSDRISLAPLGPEDVSTLVTDLVGSPTPQQVDRTVALSQGSPLFAEQLVAAGLPTTGPVPEQVLLPMTARVAALNPPTGHLVQLASLAEGNLSHRLLTQAYAATTHSGDDMASAAGQALDAHILRYDPAGHAYSFTHALLRQAAEASMAPTERIRGHRAWAQVLSQPENHVGDRLVQIAAAHHWAEAEDDVQAFDSALSAADHAAWLGGPREVATLLRRALTLWDRVPDAEVRADRTRDVLLFDAIQASDNSGRLKDAVEILSTELNRAADTDSLRILCLRVMYADLRGLVNTDVDMTVFDDARSRLDELISAESAGLVFCALRSLGWYLRNTEPEESFRLHTRAAHVAGQLDGMQRGAAPMSFIDHLRQRGRFEEALALLEEASSRETNSVALMSFACDIGETHYRAGRFGEAIEAYQRCLARLRDPHLMPGWWAYVSRLLAMALHDTGDWEAAEALLLRALTLDYDDRVLKAIVTATAGHFACRRGDLVRAQDLTTLARSVLPAAHHDQAFFPAMADARQLEAELSFGRGDLHTARRHLDRLVTSPGVDAYGDLWEAVALAAQVEGDLAEDDDAAAAHRAAIRSAVDRLPRSGGYWAASHRQAHADLARADGMNDAASWGEVVDAWRSLGHVPRLGWALLRYAAALAQRGDREAAGAALNEAWDLAARLDAAPLRDGVIDLARRTHTKLDATTAEPAAEPSAAGSLSRLTARELEVLRHLCVGESNDEIAAALFISPKTASVHVSRILTKLAVTSRAKATAVAYDEGLMATRTAG